MHPKGGDISVYIDRFQDLIHVLATPGNLGCAFGLDFLIGYRQALWVLSFEGCLYSQRESWVGIASLFPDWEVDACLMPEVRHLRSMGHDISPDLARGSGS